MQCSSCGAAIDGAASSCVRCAGSAVTDAGGRANHDPRAGEPQVKRSSLIPLVASATLSFVSLIVISLSLPMPMASWLPGSRMNAAWTKSVPAIVRFSSLVAHVPEPKGESTDESDPASEAGPNLKISNNKAQNGAVPLPTRVAREPREAPVDNRLSADHRSSERRRETFSPEETSAIKNMLDVGQSLYSNGDYDMAIMEFRKVLALAPGNSLASEGISNATAAKATEQKILKR
jgi:hypothetical protein